MLTILMALMGLIAIAGGIILFILRKRGMRLNPTPDDEETQRILRKAFGKNTKWGGAGGTESEMHDHSNHGSGFGGDSGGDSSD